MKIRIYLVHDVAINLEANNNYERIIIGEVNDTYYNEKQLGVKLVNGYKLTIPWTNIRCVIEHN